MNMLEKITCSIFLMLFTCIIATAGESGVLTMTDNQFWEVGIISTLFGLIRVGLLLGYAVICIIIARIGGCFGVIFVVVMTLMLVWLGFMFHI